MLSESVRKMELGTGIAAINVYDQVLHGWIESITRKRLFLPEDTRQDLNGLFASAPDGIDESLTNCAWRSSSSPSDV